MLMRKCNTNDQPRILYVELCMQQINVFAVLVVRRCSHVLRARYKRGPLDQGMKSDS